MWIYLRAGMLLESIFIIKLHYSLSGINTNSLVWIASVWFNAGQQFQADFLSP